MRGKPTFKFKEICIYAILLSVRYAHNILLVDRKLFTTDT